MVGKRCSREVGHVRSENCIQSEKMGVFLLVYKGARWILLPYSEELRSKFDLSIFANLSQLFGHELVSFNSEAVLLSWSNRKKYKSSK